jgi:deoxyribodipyrimidine photo-lyase
VSVALVWFRRDLRLHDNPALTAALRAGHAVLPVYVHAPAEQAPWVPGAASDWWLHHALTALDASLAARGSRLLLRAGASAAALDRLVVETGAEAVYWNRLYEPAAIARDTEVKKALRSRGVHAESHNGALLIEPWDVQTQQGDPYRVFTPFWRSAQARLGAASPVPAPARLPAPSALSTLPSLVLADLELLPRLPWADGFRDVWQPGEAGALLRLQAFCGQALDGYQQQRDRPDHDGTSRLSPHLHFGELSPRQALAAVEAAAATGGVASDAEVYRRELGWREFSHHLLYHYPHTDRQPLNPRFDAFPWRQDAAGLAAWRRGRTGIPIVDAGMRQLWHTGWMHNRVRMIVASVLTKNLGLHWHHGADWFWDTLVDASLANNTQGWQWSAGSGADAAPYFRIFNPVTQGERFDPDGDYVTRWVPELAGVPARWRQQPWTAPAAELDRAGLARDSVYRRPLIDLRATRERALAAWAQVRDNS